MNGPRRMAGLGIVLALATGLCGCAGGRISLGTNAGACFRALPPARGATHGKGKLVGVRRVSAATLKARMPEDSTLATLPAQDLCVFAFNGSYAAGTVAGAATGAANTNPGRFAIVAVSTKSPAVVASAVVDELPTRFAHLH